MFQQEVDRKSGLVVAGVLIAVMGVGFVGYNAYQHKSVDDLEARRDWQMNREMGIPLSIEGEAGLSAEERKQARKAALEQSQWRGQSVVENVAPSPPQ